MDGESERDGVGKVWMSVGFGAVHTCLSDVSHEPELSLGVSEVFVMCGMLWYARTHTHTLSRTLVCVIPLMATWHYTHFKFKLALPFGKV